eukprot:m.48155 g.48155  ORF g.48155 m.48155 type:complete len:55 (-) comp15796_c0_seq1:982-1146(-)
MVSPVDEVRHRADRGQTQLRSDGEPSGSQSEEQVRAFSSPKRASLWHLKLCFRS